MQGSGTRRAAIALVMGLALGVAGAARAETLADALIGAYRNSGLLEQNRALLRAADEDVAQAVATLRPVLNYVAQTGYQRNLFSEETSSSLGLSAELLLYDGGGSRLAIDAAKEAVLAAREALRAIEQEVLLRAVAAYMNVRRAEEFVALRENNERLITQELRAANDRFEVGEITRTDVSIAEARLAESRSLLAAAQGDLLQAREEYRAVVGIYPVDLAPPPGSPAIPDSPEAARALALRAHPDIREAQRNVAVTELNILRAQADLLPRVRATASVGVDDELDSTRSVGVDMSGPIYQGGRLSSVIRQAQARRDAARGTLHAIVDNIELAVGNAYADLAVTRARIVATEGQIRAAGLALEGVQEESRLGARTTLDVLNAEQELLDARAAEISAEIDRYIAVYAVLEATGMLTVDHLNLGIATYDPAAYYKAVEGAPVRRVSPEGEKLDRVLRALGRN